MNDENLKQLRNQIMSDRYSVELSRGRSEAEYKRVAKIEMDAKTTVVHKMMSAVGEAQARGANPQEQLRIQNEIEWKGWHELLRVRKSNYSQTFSPRW